MTHPDWFLDISALGQLPDSSRVVTAGLVTRKFVSMTREGTLIVRFTINSYGSEVVCTVIDGDPDDELQQIGREVIVKGIVDKPRAAGIKGPLLLVEDMKPIGTDGAEYAPHKGHYIVP